MKESGIVNKMPKMLCAQSEESRAIGEAVWKLQKSGNMHPDWKTVEIAPVAATTVADSISVDIPRDGLAAVRAVIESGGAAVAVPDAEILAAIPELARGAGVFAEPAASCAWAGLKKAAREGLVKPEETVVCMCTGNGLKDVASARKVAGDPTPVEASAAAAMAATAGMG